MSVIVKVASDYDHGLEALVAKVINIDSTLGIRVYFGVLIASNLVTCLSHDCINVVTHYAMTNQ